jgi:hypothetical protein
MIVQAHEMATDLYWFPTGKFSTNVSLGVVVDLDRCRMAESRAADQTDRNRCSDQMRVQHPFS